MFNNRENLPSISRKNVIEQEVMYNNNVSSLRQNRWKLIFKCQMIFLFLNSFSTITICYVCYEFSSLSIKQTRQCPVNRLQRIGSKDPQGSSFFRTYSWPEDIILARPVDDPKLIFKSVSTAQAWILPTAECYCHVKFRVSPYPEVSFLIVRGFDWFRPPSAGFSSLMAINEWPEAFRRIFFLEIFFFARERTPLVEAAFHVWPNYSGPPWTSC